MATYKFTIETADKTAIGLPANFLGEANTDIVADRGFARSTKFSTLVAKFGDGYEQRVRDGINNRQDTFDLTFANRPPKEANLITAYFDLKRGRKFTFTVADGFDANGNIQDTNYNVVCDEYSIGYTNTESHVVTATFRRVYEP